MANDYMIDLGIDPKILKQIDDTDEALGRLSTSAKNATTSLSETLVSTAKSGELLIERINDGATAAKNLQKVAKETGADIEKAFSASKVDTKSMTDKVAVFVAKMKDVIGKPVDFKFNLDQTAINLLITKLKEAKGQVSGFEVVLATAKTELAKLADGSPAFNKLSKQIQDAEKFLNVLKEDVIELKDEIADVPEPKIDPVPEAAEPKVKSLRLQLREMREELARMELAGQSGTTAFIELSRQAGELQDQIGDTSQRIQRLASDTKGLDALIAGARGLAGAFAVVQGAAAALGSQNEALQQTIAKVQGAMAILQGIQELANVLNKDSALSVYLQTFARQKNTTAIVAETVAIEAETVATEAATTATSGFTAVLLANPITAIIAALALLSFAVYEFVTASDNAATRARALNNELSTLKGVFDQLAASIKRSNEVDIERLKLQNNLAQSEVNKLILKGLEERYQAEKTNEERLRNLAIKGQNDSKIDVKEKQALFDEFYKAQVEANATYQELLVRRLQFQKQKADEENKLNLDLLKARFANNEAQRAILEEGRKYAVEIQTTKTNELRDGLQKELAILKQNNDEKIKALSNEGDAKLRQLEEQRRELDFDKETNTKVLEVQKAGLDSQIAQERANLVKRNELVAAITEAGEIERLKIIEKYRSEQAQFDLEISGKLLDLQKDSEAKRLAILTNAAELEIEQIRAKNLSKENEESAINAVLQKLDKDSAEATLKSGQDQIELDKQIYINRVNESKAFASKAEGVVALKNIAILQLEQDAAQKQLDLLRKSGKEETDAEVVNAKARVDAATDAVNEAIRKKPAKSLLGILLPDASPEQLANIEQNVQRIMSSLSQAVDSYYNVVNDRYQKMIDIKKQAVQQDEDNLATLQDQLQREQDLRAKGYANNVDGINAQLAAATAQRQKDIQEQEEYQKRLAKSQKAQADAQTALQAANLITASTNIYLQATAVGGPVAVPVAIAAIAAMVAAFVISKAETSKAVNTQSFGDGGEINGKSHAQGGEKYYAASGSGSVMELEDGEYVINKKSTEKYRPLLEIVNTNTSGELNDWQLAKLLSGLGVTFDNANDRKEALQEARIYSTNLINNINVDTKTPRELMSIDEGIKTLVKQSEGQVTMYEEGDFNVVVKGNKKIKTRKK